MKAILNATTFDYHTFAADQYVLYDEQILAVGDMKEYPLLEARPTETIDARGMLLMPGHVLGHSHIYSAFSRGQRLTPFAPRTFTERLKQLWWKLDAEYDLNACYQSARVCGVEYLKSGVTTVIDHHAGGYIRGSLEAIRHGLVEELGVRGLLCLETSDRFNLDECIAENVAFAGDNPGDGKCRGMFGLHACLTLSDDSLRRIASKRDGIPIHSHLGESLEEELQSLNLYGARSAERLDRAGLLDKNALLAHCTNIDEAEAEILGMRGCTAAINPTANLNANNGMPDAALLKRHGIPTIIGTDSLGSSVTREYQNTYYIMQTRLNDRTTKKFSQNDLLECIRAGYAYASRLLNAKLGRIAPGYEADLLLLPLNVSTEMAGDNAFAYLMGGIYNHFFPREVIVGGVLKVHEYRTIFDEEEIYAQSRQSAKDVWRRVERSNG